ncbi:MAG TPA: hypothetical protein VFC99_19815 [Acidimicrobiia bacterium]|nr:hypothetical protein [Acidimicrobiia bacterium]
MAQATTPQYETHRLRLHALGPSSGATWDPGYGAFWLLRLGFFVAPVLFGIDKFYNWMVPWKSYLWAGAVNNLPGTATQIMYGVGVLEIVAGIVVLLWPRIGSLLVAGWLVAIVVDLVLVGIDENEYWDIALRDFGLFLGAVSLFLLATKYARRPAVESTRT